MRRDLSEREIDAAFDEIRALVRARQFDAALTLCNKLLLEWPDKEQHHVYGRLAYVYDQMHNKNAAVDALTLALEREHNDAGHWDHRMILAIDVGSFKLAINDATSLIELEQRRGSIAFIESARVYRAYALIQLGEVDKAIEDLSMVNDPGPFRIAGKWWLRTELMELAKSPK